ncbi:MAG: YggS family pyridoxal phosphate-dependent enzyme, partial [Pseudomonadota bacterium]
MFLDLKTRLDEVNRRIKAACRRAGRNPAEVRLVAVSKTVPAEVVQGGIQAGVTILGENYVQEAQKKIEALGRENVAWHFIGRLQSNKANYAVKLFDLIHSVDSYKLALELDRRAKDMGRPMPILIQVNISGEASKAGVETKAAAGLVESVRKLDHLEVQGLMTL